MSGCKDDFLVKGVWRVVGPYKVVSFVLMAVWDKIPTILHLISKGKKSLIGVACARETMLHFIHSVHTGFALSSS